MHWEQVCVLVGVLSPLVAVPLMVITLYLRAIREHQTTTMAEMTIVANTGWRMEVFDIHMVC